MKQKARELKVVLQKSVTGRWSVLFKSLDFYVARSQGVVDRVEGGYCWTPSYSEEPITKRTLKELREAILAWGNAREWDM